MKHRARQSTGEGILLTRMIRTQEGDSPGRRKCRTMPKLGQRPTRFMSQHFRGFEVFIKGNLSQSNDNRDLAEKL